MRHALGGLVVLATSRSCSVPSLPPDGVALAGILRPGNAGSKTATDHIEAIDLALARSRRRGADRVLQAPGSRPSS